MNDIETHPSIVMPDPEHDSTIICRDDVSPQSTISTPRAHPLNATEARKKCLHPL